MRFFRIAMFFVIAPLMVFAGDLFKSNERFDLFCEEEDLDAAEILWQKVEENYVRIASDFQGDLSSKVSIYVYPDIDSFRKAIGWPEAPDWVIGHYRSGPHCISLVSPNHPGPVHNETSVFHSLVHHIVQSFVQEKSGPGTPRWLKAGIGLVEARQDFLNYKSFRRITTQPSLLPTLNLLEAGDDIAIFQENDGFAASYLYVQFILNQWGWENLLKILADYRSMESVLGLSKEALREELMASF